MPAAPLADAFLAARGEGTIASPGTLEERLTALCTRAEAGAPELDLDRALFAGYLGTHALAAERVVAAEDIDDEALFELRLACALRRGDEVAARIFDRKYVAPLDTTLGAMRLDDATRDEVKQRVRTKLCVADAGRALRLEGYAGRGRLAGLVQVVATREAIGLARATQRQRPIADEDLFGAPEGGRDPELELLRMRHAAELKAAFEAALRGLSSRERNLLRQHLLGGVGLEPLAEIYGVHRATVVRWLAHAREQVASATKARLRERLRVRPDELESLLGLVESRLDLSVERMLRTHVDDDDDEDPPSHQ